MITRGFIKKLTLMIALCAALLFTFADYNLVSVFADSEASSGAQGSQEEYTLTLICEGKEKTVKQKYGEYYALYTPKKENYVFIGWFTKADGEGVEIKSDVLYRSHSDSTLYAYFEKEAMPTWVYIAIAVVGFAAITAVLMLVRQFSFNKTRLSFAEQAKIDLGIEDEKSDEKTDKDKMQ